MDVLFITRKWPPAVGGMETYSMKMAEGFQRAGTLRILALPGRRTGAPPSAPSVLAFGIGAAFRILFSRKDAEAVMGGDLALWPLVWLAALRHGKASRAIAVHGNDIAYADRTKLTARLYARYLDFAAVCLGRTQLIANSRATAAKLSARGFRNIQVVTLAAETVAIEIAEQPEPYLLFVGRLKRQKGCNWFIENVLAHLPPHVTLKVAGSVPKDGEAPLPLDGRVEFLGPVHGADLARLRARALAVIVPNIDTGADGFEGFGLTAPEAALAGGVVLASDLHGIADAVIDGETGFLVPPGDAVAWRAKVLRVMSWSPAERVEFVAAAKAKAADVYNWDRVTEATLSILSGGARFREPQAAAPASG